MCLDIQRCLNIQIHWTKLPRSTGESTWTSYFNRWDRFCNCRLNFPASTSTSRMSDSTADEDVFIMLNCHWTRTLHFSCIFSMAMKAVSILAFSSSWAELGFCLPHGCARTNNVIRLFAKEFRFPIWRVQVHCEHQTSAELSAIVRICHITTESGIGPSELSGVWPNPHDPWANGNEYWIKQNHSIEFWFHRFGIEIMLQFGSEIHGFAFWYFDFLQMF